MDAEIKPRPQQNQADSTTNDPKTVLRAYLAEFYALTPTEDFLRHVAIDAVESATPPVVELEG